MPKPRKAAPKAKRTKQPGKPAAKKAAPRKAAPKPPPRKLGPRSDLGAPVDGFYARQPASLAPILEELRALVHEAAPEATSSLKWGMPFYELGGQTLCAVAGFKTHVNLILPGPPGTYADPQGRLEGEGKTGRHLKLRAGEDVPSEAIRGWLLVAVDRASRGG